MLTSLERYLKENIDDSICISYYQGKNKFPLFLRKMYDFYQVVILDSKCILLEILNETPNVDTIEKHIKRIRELTNEEVVICYKEISRYRRRNLIQNRIPFIVEDGQMFLPFLGLSLKMTPDQADKEFKVFSTSTQLAYLYFLYHKETVINATDFAKEMNWTVMTASRVLNDLYNARLMTYRVGGRTGRSKEYQRVSDPEYFKRGCEYLKSPIKKIVYVNGMPEKSLIAGVDALAEQSMINPPKYPIRAISWGDFNKQDIEIVKDRDAINKAKLVELQIWWYNPRQFTDRKYVDSMSLYASLKDETDERIEQALEDVLRGETWYMG